MKKVLKWTGMVLGGLLGLALLAAVSFGFKARAEIARTYDVQVEALTLPVQAPSAERGRHLAEYLCAECHGDDLGGAPDWLALPGLVSISPPNLTAGEGSITAGYSDEDWIRTLRHGVKPDGTSVFVMPSGGFYYLSDPDLADLLRYVQTLPPVDRGEAGALSVRTTFLGNVLYGAGAFGDLLEARTIDHVNRPAAFPEAAVTPAYGEYLININACRDCHGAQLAGAKPADPNSPLAPNLTPGGELAAWTEADFIKTLREGVALSGHELDPVFMPWPYKGKMSDEELKAIFAYLQSLPKMETSTQPVE